MEYRIVFDHQPEGLEREVTKYLATGWVPQGGVSLSRVNGHEIWAQAVVRQATEKTDA